MGSLLSARLFGDDHVVRRVREGQPAAEAELFARYAPMLTRFCRSILLSQDEAEDAVQATMVKALESLRRRPLDVPLRPWLFRIAHNSAVDILRRRRPTEDYDIALATVAAPERGDRDRLRQLVADLMALPERQRSALVLLELSDLAYDEIAVVLGSSVPAARQTVHEARLALTECRDGRLLACGAVQDVLEGGDRRLLRGRRLRAHLRDCSECDGVRASVAARRRDLRLLVPFVPVSGWWVIGGGGAATVAPKLATSLACALCAGAGVVAELPERGADPPRGQVVARAPGHHAARTRDAGRRTAATPAPAVSAAPAASTAPSTGHPPTPAANAAPRPAPGRGARPRPHRPGATERPPAAPSPAPAQAAPTATPTPAPTAPAAPTPTTVAAVPSSPSRTQVTVTQAALAGAQKTVDDVLALSQTLTQQALHATFPDTP